MFAFLLTNLFVSIFTVLPIWNLNSSSIDLLKDRTEWIYTITNRNMYGLTAILEKNITKTDENIKHENTLYINGNSKGRVEFENIESLYNIDNNNILCPTGKFNPINLDTMSQIGNNNLDTNNNWNLKCYYHGSGNFLVFYLNNGEKQIYKLNGVSSYTDMNDYKLHRELYDFKLANKEGSQYNPYPICGIISWNDYIQFLATQYNFEDLSNGASKMSSHLNKQLIAIKSNTKGTFKSDSNDFFYFTYNSISDFSSGYSTNTVSGTNYYTVDPVQVSNNFTSPFEFIDDVEIIDMNFLLSTNYAYYTIKNKITEVIYHGILDIKLNKIIFNTDENIDIFIPYSTDSMLAITKETAYRICFIKDSTNCLSQCTENSNILDTDGNKCGTGCDDGKYLIVPEGVCSSICDNSIYVIRETNCGLCKDVDSTNKYKIINGTECVSGIIDGSEEYNSDLKLLVCKSGYILNGSICSPHCYESCELCTEYSTDKDDQKCISCKEGYYKDSDETSNCKKIIPTTIITTIPTTVTTTIPTTIITTMQTTIPTTIISMEFNIVCSEENKEKCAKCNERSNSLGLCLACNEGYKRVNYTIFNPEFFDCLKIEDPFLKKFYYDESSNQFKPCYKTCKTCLTGGDAEANNCLECQTGYMFRPEDNPKNNCVVYSEFYYISSYNQYKSLDIYQCPEESKYRIKGKKSCIDDCKKDDEYKYLYNGNCVKECPSNTINDNYVCKEDSDKCFVGKDELYLKNNNLDVIETLVRTYISEFDYTNKHISQHYNINYTIVIYKNANCIKELSLDIPNVDFKTCYTKVQQFYNIEQDLIIAIVDRKELSNPSTFFSFYHPISGKKLDADEICKEESIIVEENLNSILDENSTIYEVQTSLTDQGINIFDLNDPFYNDICYDFDNPLEKDIPLNDRIKDIYPNATLCDDGCQYEGINLEDMTATCNCKFNDIINNALIKDNEILNNMMGEVLDLINSSNILVLKCFKDIFKHFSKSVGGWLSLTLICGHIGMCVFYFIIELGKMSSSILSLTNNFINYVLISIKSNPPKKIINNNLKKGAKKKINKVLISDVKDEFDNKSDKLKIHKQIKKIDKNHENKKNGFGSTKELQKFENIYKKEETQNYLDESKVNDNIAFFEEYMAESPDDMEFDDAIVVDKRKYLEHFTECLKEEQMIAHTFIADDLLKPRSVKIIVFILNVILYFVVNGFFFSESVISELYELDEDDENFFSYFPRSIERIIYCTLVSIVIGIITDFFFIEEKKFKGLLKREKENPAILKQKIAELIKNIKIRNFAFIITASIILLFSFIYLLSFNHVYPYSQVEWIKSSITIIIIMQILSTLKCFLESSIRFLSFKLKSEKLYKIGKLLD